MNHPGLYNPCKDGFVAKAWECLRRNAEFLDTVYFFGAKTEDEAMDAITQIRANPPENPFLREALGCCMESDSGLPAEDDYSYPVLQIGTAWNEMDGRFRDRLETSLSRGEAYGFSLPNLAEVNPFSCEKNGAPNTSLSEKASRQFFWELGDTSSTHDLIAVPKVVWDSEHAAEILTDVKQLLSKPRANVKWIKPTGRTLGTKAQWDAYLLFEEWRLFGYPRQRACQLVAWELDEGSSFGPSLCDSDRDSLLAWREERKKCAADFFSKYQKAPKRGSTVERDQIGPMEEAISSVFPRFLPL